MKKLTLLFLFSSVLLFSQKDDKDNQNVELPDFVITGTEKVTVDKLKKADPDLITITSEEFIKPSYSPEELELKKFSDPLKKDINYLDSVNYQKGYLDAAAGMNYIPSGKIFYSAIFNGGIFSGQLNGLYRRAYVSNADKVILDGSTQFDFFTGANSSFLPGSEYKFKAKYGFDSYKIFASSVPETRRTINNINGLAGYRNFHSDNFQAALDAGIDYTGLSKETFKDMMTFVSGYANMQTENFLLSLESQFKSFSLSNNFSNGIGLSFFSIMPKMGLRVSDAFKADIGIYFSRGAGVTSSHPYFSVSLKVDKRASFIIEYNPHADIINAFDFLKENPYLDLAAFNNQYIVYDGFMTFGIKYEYEKYFQINAAIKYKSSNQFTYYVPSALQGYFTLASTDAKMFGGFLDLLYHLGPMGYFYGNIDLKIVTDTSKMLLPYNPAFTTKAAYGFSFKKLKLDTEIGINYSSSVYTDIANTIKLPSFVDLGIKFTYLYKPKFLITLELSNLLNKSNYRWAGYKEIPINVSAGIRLLL